MYHKILYTKFAQWFQGSLNSHHTTLHLQSCHTPMQHDASIEKPFVVWSGRCSIGSWLVVQGSVQDPVAFNPGLADIAKALNSTASGRGHFCRFAISKAVLTPSCTSGGNK